MQCSFWRRTGFQPRAFDDTTTLSNGVFFCNEILIYVIYSVYTYTYYWEFMVLMLDIEYVELLLSERMEYLKQNMKKG